MKCYGSNNNGDRKLQTYYSSNGNVAWLDLRERGFLSSYPRINQIINDLIKADANLVDASQIAARAAVRAEYIDQLRKANPETLKLLNSYDPKLIGSILDRKNGLEALSFFTKSDLPLDEIVRLCTK
jgi:hypothetical protein